MNTIRKKENVIPRSISLPPDMWAWLDDAANTRRSTRSQVVRDCIVREQNEANNAKTYPVWPAMVADSGAACPARPCATQARGRKAV